MSNSPKISYVDKNEIYPLFGRANWLTGDIEIQKGLPKLVDEFVLEHEKYHIRDGKFSSIIGREIRANGYAAVRHPIGFLMTVAMSLTPDRIEYYKNLVKQEVVHRKAYRETREGIKNSPS